jgi:hypothetical protein
MQKQINEDNFYKSKVQLAMVNHRAVPKDSVINPGDRISLFPRECMETPVVRLFMGKTLAIKLMVAG